MGENYDFKTFEKQLDKQREKFNPAQQTGLEQRMSLLTSFLEPPSMAKSSSTQNRFAPGQLTIVDLSDPFLDEGAACGLFDIIIRLFIRAEVNTGKVLVVDEAHKECTVMFSLVLMVVFLTLGLVSLPQQSSLWPDENPSAPDSSTASLSYACPD